MKKKLSKKFIKEAKYLLGIKTSNFADLKGQTRLSEDKSTGVDR